MNTNETPDMFLTSYRLFSRKLTMLREGNDIYNTSLSKHVISISVKSFVSANLIA